jgi:hypothetical protein
MVMPSSNLLSSTEASVPKKLYRSARKLSRGDVAFIRASNLSAASIALKLEVTADHVRKIRRGDRAVSVPAWVKPSRADHLTRRGLNALLKISRQLRKEALCEAMWRKLFTDEGWRCSQAPVLKTPYRNELFESREWVIARRVSQNGGNNGSG